MLILLLMSLLLLLLLLLRMLLPLLLTDSTPWFQNPFVIQSPYYCSFPLYLLAQDPRQDILVGLLRLRKLAGSPKTRQPELKGSWSMVRELHVYGTAVAVHARDTEKFQHQGYGMMLMREAERIAREEHMSGSIAVISGVGTRHYYRKLGYRLEGNYMVKELGSSSGGKGEQAG